MSDIWIIATEQGETASLMDFFKLKSTDVTALVIGSRKLAEEASSVVAVVKWIDAKGKPTDNYAHAAVRTVLDASPVMTLGVSSPGTRAVLGKVAAESSASVASNITSVSVNNNLLRVERLILDNKLIETIEMPFHACLLVNSANLQPQMLGNQAGNIEEINAQSEGSVEYVSVSPVVASSLQTADRIVGVGLGATGGDLFEQVKRLAQVMKAEIGCSMPVYSDLQLMPHESYIGLTGRKVAPKLYLALGISGTSQHRAGLNNVKTIVCVNKDPKALFFDHADYGIVGDLNEVLPVLISVLDEE